MSELSELRKKHAAIRAERATLEEQLAACNPDDNAARRKLRVQIALLNDELVFCNDSIREQQYKIRVEKERKIKLARQAEIQRQRDEEAEYQAILADMLANNAPPDAVGVSLRDLAKSYRYQADVVRHRIQLVSEIRPSSQKEEVEQTERLRILTAMLRDLRDIAVICERYYEPGYHICAKYSISM